VLLEHLVFTWAKQWQEVRNYSAFVKPEGSELRGYSRVWTKVKNYEGTRHFIIEEEKYSFVKRSSPTRLFVSSIAEEEKKVKKPWERFERLYSWRKEGKHYSSTRFSGFANLSLR
jgi:hypothetical protein